MSKEAFQELTFRGVSPLIIERANTIIDDYLRQGYRLTLRQLYYQFIARDLFPEQWIDAAYNRKNGLPDDTKNTEKNYKRLGDLMNNARLAGLVDWSAIEDRTRNLRTLSHWDDPANIIYNAYAGYRIDKWAEQPNRVEVWVEKDALLGVISGICERNQVPYFACRGYVSQSEMYDTAQRLQGYIDEGQSVHILHLGDHDPSGIDMTRDIIDRIAMFLGGDDAEIHRLALNIQQVRTYNPPPNPAKTTDSRYTDYAANFGDESWELDALEPRVLSDLIARNIDALRDDAAWATSLERENDDRELLRKCSAQWSQIAHTLRAQG